MALKAYTILGIVTPRLVVFFLDALVLNVQLSCSLTTLYNDCIERSVYHSIVPLTFLETSSGVILGMILLD